MFMVEGAEPGPIARPAAHVTERFPVHELTIERLFRKSESFRSMCEDYALGVEALGRWERGRDPKRAVRIAELRESLAELEAEILEALAQAATPPSGQRRRNDEG
jgi:hypothetical protein